MTKLRNYDELEARLFTPDQIEEARRWARAEAAAIDIRELRKLLRISQAELAKRLNKDQPELSRLERRRDLRLSTLSQFVNALGGELELYARFGEKSLKLTNVWLDERVHTPNPSPSRANKSHKPRSRRKSNSTDIPEAA